MERVVKLQRVAACCAFYKSEQEEYLLYGHEYGVGVVDKPEVQIKSTGSVSFIKVVGTCTVFIVDSTIHFYNDVLNAPDDVVALTSTCFINHVDLTLDPEKTIASVGDDGDLTLWTLDGVSCSYALLAPGTSCQFHKTRDWVLACDSSGVVRLLDWRDGIENGVWIFNLVLNSPAKCEWLDDVVIAVLEEQKWAVYSIVGQSGAIAVPTVQGGLNKGWTIGPCIRPGKDKGVFALASSGTMRYPASPIQLISPTLESKCPFFLTNVDRIKPISLPLLPLYQIRDLAWNSTASTLACCTGNTIILISM
jgi:hypothetical protein